MAKEQMLWGKYKVWIVKTYKQGVKQTNQL